MRRLLPPMCERALWFALLPAHPSATEPTRQPSGGLITALACLRCFRAGRLQWHSFFFLRRGLRPLSHAAAGCCLTGGLGRPRTASCTAAPAVPTLQGFYCHADLCSAFCHIMALNGCSNRMLFARGWACSMPCTIRAFVRAVGPLSLFTWLLCAHTHLKNWFSHC